MSTIALHSSLNISETVRVEACFQRTTNRKLPTGNQMVTHNEWQMAPDIIERWKAST